MSGDGSSAVLLDVDGPVATIRINRPEVRNALDLATWRALHVRLQEVEEAFPSARVAVLRGAGGRAFVAGADIAEMASLARTREAARAYVELVEAVMQALQAMPQPVIAAVEGAAVGAGLELMSACDLRIARAGSRIGIPAARLGLAITGQDLHRLERLVGVGRVKWLLMTGRLITAEEAAGWGLVDAVHPEEIFEQEVLALAHEVAANSSLTHRLTKRALLAYRDPLEQGAEAGFACSLPAWSSASLAEGVAAFVERRSPDFASVESRTLTKGQAIDDAQ